jgi:hypothetical protein
MPIVEKKDIKIESSHPWVMPVEKWRCPNCTEKELPFLDSREIFGESSCRREWNRIASQENYCRRTLAYNEHGVCVDKPFKVFEWRGKRGGDFIRIKFYLDNGAYYYCYDFCYGNGGEGSALWLGHSCYPSMESAKKSAAEKLAKVNGIKEIVESLLFAPEQGELFL